MLPLLAILGSVWFTSLLVVTGLEADFRQKSKRVVYVSLGRPQLWHISVWSSVR